MYFRTFAYLLGALTKPGVFLISVILQRRAPADWATKWTDLISNMLCVGCGVFYDREPKESSDRWRSPLIDDACVLYII